MFEQRVFVCFELVDRKQRSESRDNQALLEKFPIFQLSEEDKRGSSG